MIHQAINSALRCEPRCIINGNAEHSIEQDRLGQKSFIQKSNLTFREIRETTLRKSSEGS